MRWPVAIRWSDRSTCQAGGSQAYLPQRLRVLLGESNDGDRLHRETSTLCGDPRILRQPRLITAPRIAILRTGSIQKPVQRHSGHPTPELHTGTVLEQRALAAHRVLCGCNPFPQTVEEAEVVAHSYFHYRMVPLLTRVPKAICGRHAR
jgi:hypothetical protein